MRKIAAHVVGDLRQHKHPSTMSSLLLATVVVACVRLAWSRLKNDCWLQNNFSKTEALT